MNAVFVMKVLLAVLLSIIIIILALGFWRTKKIQNDEQEKIFLKGTVPNPKPDGLYQGIFLGQKSSWRGKKFDAQNSTGINVFDNGSGLKKERYPFKTFEGRGLLDKNMSVLKIDYNIQGNPWWLRFIVDEVVQVQPNQYLGKMIVTIIPGFPVGILYFELHK